MNILNNYEILSILGEGTFGVVRLGKNKETGERVAIKILEKKKIINKDDAERVDREIDILKRIKHINIVKVMNIESDPERIYIIMEFCQNGELFCHIVEKQQLDEQEAAYFYYQLINGLECLHYNGIVHRDLKPENLLISKDDLLKIIDFGLSNYFTSKSPLLTTPCGSPCYASPEMVSGKKYDGFSIDIWSTGIILYAMLCGYLPYEDSDNEVLFQKITSCDTEFPEDISCDGIDLMKKIMVPEPKERISLSEIKKHKFYLKGKNAFKSLHPDLVKEVEINYDLKKEKENDNDILEKEIKRKEIAKSESASVKEEIVSILENEENKQTKDKKFEQDIDKDKDIKVNNKKVIEEKEKEKVLRRLLNEDNNNFKSKSSDNVEDKNKENKETKIKEIKIDFSNLNKIRENKKIIENNNNKVNNKVINSNYLNKNNDNKKAFFEEKKNNLIENNEKPKLNINNNKNDNEKSVESHHNSKIIEKKELMKSPEKKLSDKINTNINQNINSNYINYKNSREPIHTKDILNINPKEQINNKANKTVSVQINTQINCRRRENNNNNIINYKNEKERKTKINVNKISKNNNYKANNTIDYKESDFIKNEIPDLKKRSTLNGGNDRNYIIQDKNNINNLKSYKTSINKIAPKNKIKIIEESNKTYSQTTDYNTLLKNKKSSTKEVKVNKNFVINHDKNNKIDAESINTKVNDIYNNTKNIPNLKNKINISKTIVIEKRKSSKQNKIPTKIEIIVNKRNKMIKYKEPGVTESQTINTNYIISENNYKLTENENKSNKINSITSKNNFILKRNSLENALSEPQESKRKKNIIYSNHKNSNNNNLNPKLKEEHKIFSYNNENINNENKKINSKRENPFSFSKFNLNKDLLKNKIPNIKECKTLNNTLKVETIDLESNCNSHRNKNLYIANQNSSKLSAKISGNDLNQYQEKTKSIYKNSQNNYSKQEYNNKTFNKNTIYKSNIYNNNNNTNNSKDYKTLNEIEENIDYRKKSNKKNPIFQPFESNTYQNKDYHILHKNQYLTNYIVAEKNGNEEKKVNPNKNKEISTNIHSYLKESSHHKKNVSENIQKSITTIKREIYEQNLFNNTDSKSPKNELRTEKFLRFKQRKNHNYYISTYKKGICEKKLMNYISNDSLNLHKKDIQQLNLLRKNETFQYANNTTNPNSHRKNEDLTKKMKEFSNIIDKDNATKYDNNTLTLNNNDSPIKLYTNNHQSNNCRNNYIIPRRINSTYVNNFSYNNNINNDNKRRISSNCITDNKNKINNRYINNKLIRKGLVFNSDKDNLKHYINNNNYNKDNLERNNTMLIVDKNLEIYNIANNNLNKNNHHYLYNSTIGSNTITINENHKNLGINRTKTTMDNVYKKRLNFDEIKSEEHRNKIGNIIDNNNNKKIITSVSMKRSDNSIFLNNNEKSNRRFKYIEHINTNTNNLQENISRNIINSCTQKNTSNYKSNNNPINSNNNDKNNNQNIQMINTTNKRKHQYQKADLEELIIKLTNAKNEYKKYKEQENHSFNRKPNLENMKNMKQNIKSTYFIPQEINIDISEQYINKNNKYINQFKTRNFQTATLGDSFDKMNGKRRTITTNNDIKGDINLDQNFNYVFKQNNFYNNRNARENIYDYKYVQK